jgi:hypothetical protein
VPSVQLDGVDVEHAAVGPQPDVAVGVGLHQVRRPVELDRRVVLLHQQTPIKRPGRPALSLGPFGRAPNGFGSGSSDFLASLEEPEPFCNSFGKTASHEETVAETVISSNIIVCRIEGVGRSLFSRASALNRKTALAL